MNALAAYYISLILVILAVLSNRYWRRQIKKAREQLEVARVRLDDVTKKMAAVGRELSNAQMDVGDLTKRADKAVREQEHLQGELERKKKGPMERYHVFDRSEPKTGAFWEVAIRCTGADEAQYVGRQYWDGVRTYLMIADTEGAAIRRAQTKFPAQLGYQVVQGVPCKVQGLTISRVDGISTFRKPSAEPSDAAKGAVGS